MKMDGMKSTLPRLVISLLFALVWHKLFPKLLYEPITNGKRVSWRKSHWFFSWSGGDSIYVHALDSLIAAGCDVADLEISVMWDVNIMLKEVTRIGRLVRMDVKTLNIARSCRQALFQDLESTITSKYGQICHIHYPRYIQYPRWQTPVKRSIHAA